VPILLTVILAASALGTAFISGILGMAGGMILMGILLALLPVPAAMLLHGTTQLASNGWRAWLWRGAIDRRVFRQYSLGSMVAFALFASVAVLVSKRAAFVALGAMPFVAVALPGRWRLDVARRGHSFACGALCSALALAAGVSGPILDVFFARTDMARQAVVATKAATQSVSHLLKILYFGGLVAGLGAVNPWTAVAMIVLALAGTQLSRPVLERMGEETFRSWTRWTVMATGTFYLASGCLM